MDNIAVGVMTSVNLINRFMACKNTWLKNFRYKWMFGGCLKHPDLISLGEDVGEDKNSAFKKQFLGLKYMYEQTKDNEEVEWYYLVGCDTFPYKKRLQEVSDKFNPKDYLYITGKGNSENIAHLYKGPTNIRCAFGGAGFLLSKSVLSKMHNDINKFIENWPSIFCSEFKNMGIECCDIALAYMLAKYYNIMLTTVDGEDDGFYGINYINPANPVKRPVVFHRVYPSQMYQLYSEKDYE